MNETPVQRSSFVLRASCSDFAIFLQNLSILGSPATSCSPIVLLLLKIPKHIELSQYLGSRITACLFLLCQNLLISTGPQACSVKGWIVNVLGFAGLTFSLLQLLISGISATDKT